MDKGINKDIIKEIKKYILKGLESKIEQILKDKSKNMFLTKRDMLSLSRYMERRKILSYNLIRFIFKRSIYSHDLHKKIIVTFNNIILIACKKGDLKVVRFLISDEIVARYKTFYLSIVYNYGFSEACVGGNLEVVKYLLRFSHEQKISFMKIDPCEKSNKALLYACESGHIEIVKYLLLDDMRKQYPKMSKIGDNNSDAIKCASAHNRIDIVKFLLSREIKELYPKTDPFKSGIYIIRNAYMWGRFELVKLFLSDEVLRLYPDIEQYIIIDDYCLRMAKKKGHTDIVKFLLELPDEIKERNPILIGSN